MYLRPDHAERSIPILHKLIQHNPLGVLTTAIPHSSKTYPTILSSHIPWVLELQNPSNPNDLGILKGHIARANPQSKSIITHLQSLDQQNGSFLEEEVLILFTVQAQHYVTPKFYTETKPKTGKVVPTWNYAAVQAYGRARIYFDAKADDTGVFLDKQIRQLSQHAETQVMGYQEAWKVDDAPSNYVELLKKAIIGIEVHVDRLEGKFKMSQEMGLGDRKGVAEGFEALGSEVGKKMAEVVRERSEMKEKAKSG